tara:strand:- start:74 stop:208 length:135 start_codon:yes stop_codon:yes gene_type:complete
MMLSEDPDSTEKKEKNFSFKKDRSTVPILEDEDEDNVSPMKDGH